MTSVNQATVGYGPAIHSSEPTSGESGGKDFNATPAATHASACRRTRLRTSSK